MYARDIQQKTGKLGPNKTYRHYQWKHHTPSDVKVQPVECVEDEGSQKKRENAWIKALRTIEPYRLNIPPPPHTSPVLLSFIPPPIVHFQIVPPQTLKLVL